MENLKEVENKEYHFTVERHDKAKFYAPEVDIPKSDSVRLLAYELLSFRKLFLKHGDRAQFKHLAKIDLDLYFEMEEVLTDYMYSNAGTRFEREDRARRIVGAVTEYQNSRHTSADAKIMRKALDKICPFDLSDYKVVFPEELKRDVLDYNYLDWSAIEKGQKIDN